ncbi:hypothetical protein EST38_g12295 [Candolleomyces aberdarensis]|uniref:Nephrocystin 3-like N-terminal domain-containing protein n=1 Tax=Candolleomyces aberdarensis TaxID=2316362 RepID=A0A4Q2D3I9_9AGAR|nr:hypothetical protein EST38_g12295 [Candolleomyces aberdarensis]
MAVTIPEAAPFIQAAVEAASASTAMSVTEQLHRFVFEPFQAAAGRGFRSTKLFTTPFLIVIDGLDECEDQQEAQAFIDSMIDFFKHNPHIPLRFFITSRVEQHIQSHLQADSVVMDDLVGHGSRDDIATFLETAFEAESQRNPIIQAYIRQNGSWPQKTDKERLVNYIGGSFIFASALFKYIVTPSGDGLTPMKRLALAFNMDPGLDGLYTQTLARAAHLSHFSDVISTIARLRAPLSISGIADLLGIQSFEVVHVLVDLQAIIQVPGTDSLPITLCHTSLQDFLKNKSRSGRFCAPPSRHLRLAYLCFNVNMKNGQKESPLQHTNDDHSRSRQADALLYSRHACQVHWYRFWEVCWHNFDLEELARQTVPNDYVPQALGMYMLTEWTKHLARGLDSRDSDDIKHWLETPVGLIVGKWLRDGIEITDDTFKVFERNVNLAFQAVRTKLPELLPQWRYVHRTSDTFDLNLVARSLVTCDRFIGLRMDYVAKSASWGED